MFLFIVLGRNPRPLALVSRPKNQVNTFYNIRHLASETEHKHGSNYHLQCPQSTQVRGTILMNWTPQKCGPVMNSTITVYQKTDLLLSCKLQIFSSRSFRASSLSSIRLPSPIRCSFCFHILPYLTTDPLIIATWFHMQPFNIMFSFGTLV